MISKWEQIANEMPATQTTSEPEISRWEQIAGAKTGKQPSGAGGSFEQTTWGKVLTEAAVNAPRSAYMYGRNIYQAIRHPVQTAKGLGKLGLGTVQKVVPGTQEYETYFDNMVTALEERYGSVDGLKETIANDPVGILADVASVVFPAAQGAKAVGLTKTAATMTKAAALLEPVSLMGTVARKGFSLAIPKKVPSRLYESAVKLSTTLSIKERQKVVRTALREQVMPTYNGLKKLDTKIAEFNDQIVALIDKSMTTGQPIPVDRLFKGFDDLRKNIMAISGEPITGSKYFTKVEEEIRLANELLERQALTPLQAQEMKQYMYRELETEYSRLSLHPIKAEAQMAVAKNLKESLEEIIPEIKQLNANEGELIALKKAITKAAERISNRDLLSLGTTAKAAGGGVVAGAGGMAVGLTLGLLDSQPLIKSKLALVLDKIKQKGIKVRPTMLGLRLGLYQAGKIRPEKRDMPLPQLAF